MGSARGLIAVAAGDGVRYQHLLYAEDDSAAPKSHSTTATRLDNPRAVLDLDVPG
jgi:hypothetical protein